MADRLSWWVIPGALVVLTRVVTLGSGSAEAPTPVPVVHEASHAEDVVVLREATGRRSEPRSWAALTKGALVVHLPRRYAGRTGQVTVWRHGERNTPQLAVAAPVRDDGSIPIAGLAAGDYDVQVSFGTGGAPVFAERGVVVPGDCTPAAAPAR
jgi:hypothetical protein